MPYDNRCDRDFINWSAYHQRVQDSHNHNLCDDCDLDFPTWVGLKEHWVQSPRHDYCQHCNEHVNDIDDHMNTSHHYCSSCRRVFVNDLGLREHYRQSEHHHYCVPCNRLFLSAGNLNAHLNSSTHRPKDVKCPFRCGQAFVSRSALVLHLENGACTSGINRSQVDKYVRQFDTHNVITDPSRLIGGGSGISEEITYIATDRSWNGSGYECCLCYKVHRTLHALNQHLASPRHKEKVYVCRGSECGLRFNALSGLVQHVESDKCGVGRSKFVQNTMDSVLGQMGRLTM